MNEKPKSKLKLYFFLFVFIALVSLGGFGYYKYTKLVELVSSSKTAIMENKSLKEEVTSYNSLKDKLEKEKTRCEQLLLKEEGNFGDFTYCQQYIDFIDTILTK